MQSLAAIFAAADPNVAALSQIDAGDALAVATRFDCEWAYRGGQAILWSRRWTAHAVHDLYLPASALRPFDRRGLLRVDVEAEGIPLHLFATQFTSDRTAIRDLRFARSAVRGADRDVLLFIAAPPPSHIGFADLGLQSLQPAQTLAVWARGFRLELQRYSEKEPGLGWIAIATATRA